MTKKPERDLPTCVYASGSRYQASVYLARGRKKHLGTFDTPEEAEAQVALYRKHHPKKRSRVWQPGDEV